MPVVVSQWITHTCVTAGSLASASTTTSGVDRTLDRGHQAGHEDIEEICESAPASSAHRSASVPALFVQVDRDVGAAEVLEHLHDAAAVRTVAHDERLAWKRARRREAGGQVR